jgi:hypothetical protein
MARGRMISKSLSTSKKYAALYGQPHGLQAQAMYPLIVAHSDDFGRLEGDSFTVKNSIVPASNWSETEILAILTLLDAVQLVRWYEVAGARYLQVLDFERHQSGLHKRTSSRFPRVPGKSGKVRGVPLQLKGTELKGTELKGSTSSALRAPILDAPKDNIGIITRVAHEVIDQLGSTNGDLAEAVKALCAQRRIAYDGESIGKAIDSARVQRQIKAVS